MYSRAKAFEDYKENAILTAPPERLVVLLVEALSTNVSKARQAIRDGDAAARRASLRKARDIVMELMNSLDLSVGGEIALNLHRLYTYVNGRLVAADTKPSDEPLEHAMRVITILEDTWRQAVDQVMREKATLG